MNKNTRQISLLKECIRESVISYICEARGIQSRKVYDAFKQYGGWGKNGFNNMILIGVYEHDHDATYYSFPGTDQRDLMTAIIREPARFNIDITNKWDSVHFWFDKPIKMLRDPLSTFYIEVGE